MDDIRLGHVVWYRSKTGTYTCGARIAATVDSLYQPNVDAGHLLSLSSPTHVHLVVDTPGLQGHVSDDTARTHPALADPDRPNKPAGGTFQEFDIPQWDWEAEGILTWEYDEQPAGTWAWPRKS